MTVAYSAGVITVTGTETSLANFNGTLASITGTGAYPNKSFTYNDGKLIAITVG